MYAAAVTRAALQRSGRGLTESLRAANRHLHDHLVTRSRDQAQTCVTAAELFEFAWAEFAGVALNQHCRIGRRNPL